MLPPSESCDSSSELIESFIEGRPRDCVVSSVVDPFVAM